MQKKYYRRIRATFRTEQNSANRIVTKLIKKTEGLNTKQSKMQEDPP